MMKQNFHAPKIMMHQSDVSSKIKNVKKKKEKKYKKINKIPEIIMKITMLVA